jgi:hypothetical protein
MQDASGMSTLETNNTDMPLILSTILLELGILQQQDGCLVLADDNLKTIELEGDDNSKIVLELIEEEVSYIICLLSLLTYFKSDVMPGTVWCNVTCDVT